MPTSTSKFLRRALVADAALSCVTGLAMIVGARFLERLFHVPATVFVVAGLVLIPFVAFIAYLLSRSPIASGSVRAVIALNVAWVIGSVALLLADPIHPNQLGFAFVIVQALAVAAFAELQYVALRRATR